MALTSIIGADKKPNLWVGSSLRHFGTNPYDENLWRVVWAPSRVHMIGGKWGDNGQVEYRWVPRYGGKESWILEKWVDAITYAGTPEAWEITNKCPNGSGLLTCGPYPYRGEYEECFTFPAYPSTGAVERVINWIRWGKENLNLADHRYAAEEAEMQRRKAQRQRIHDIWDDKRLAFGGNAYSDGKKRKQSGELAEDIKFRVTADQLEKPVGDNKFFQSGA